MLFPQQMRISGTNYHKGETGKWKTENFLQNLVRLS